MSNVDFVERPGSVKFVTVMMYLAAASYAVGIYINLLLLMRSDQGQLFFDSPVSDWYWIIGALLDFILVVAFIWIARMAWRGDYSAGVLITLLASVNIVFSLFRLGQGYGWITLALSIAVLAANMSNSTQQWYRQSLSRLVG
ncbi:MAG: hypothetical protein ACYYNF_10355 [Actinomycetes bacterium]|jgi:hypothetical protein|nr:hypothetical protein [Candidatus Nanopelagicales bacterium]MDP4824280.1 hypothetical protein [Candidatus Nanopelagicales bacterium]